jgi:hypothetical protein
MKEQVAWEASHSVAAEASASFAWSYLTDISNWNDPPATFQLDGPFREGARGATLMPDEEPRAWRIGRVTPGESYVLEMELEGATLSFTWRCEPVSELTCRLTQTITLSGERAASYAKGIEEGFGPNLAPGMDRIAAAIGRKASSKRSGVE